MLATSVMAFFCEEITEPRAGFLSLVGVVPDLVNLSNIHDTNRPSDSKEMVTPWVYVRINFDREADIGPATLIIVYPDKSRNEIAKLPIELFQQARADAQGQGSPFASVYTYGAMEGFVPMYGRFSILVELGGETYPCATTLYRPVPPPN